MDDKTPNSDYDTTYRATYDGTRDAIRDAEMGVTHGEPTELGPVASVILLIYSIFSMLFWQRSLFGVLVKIGYDSGRPSFLTDIFLFLYEYSLNWGAHMLWEGVFNTYSLAWWVLLFVDVVTFYGVLLWCSLLLTSIFVLGIVAVVFVVVLLLISYFYENPY